MNLSDIPVDGSVTLLWLAFLEQNAREKLIFFNFYKCLPLLSCKLTSPSSLEGWNFSTSIKDIFMRQAPGISGKFLNFSRIINELVGTFRKPLLLLIFIIGFKVLCTCFWKWTTSKMNFVTREQAHPRNRLQKESCFLQISAFHACYFARAFAFSRVTSRKFSLNEIRNTESFSGAHPPLLSPASARRASNCAIWREIRVNKWILTN